MCEKPLSKNYLHAILLHGDDALLEEVLEDELAVLARNQDHFWGCKTARVLKVSCEFGGNLEFFLVVKKTVVVHQRMI